MSKEVIRLAIDRLLAKVPGARVIATLGEQEPDQVDFGEPFDVSDMDWTQIGPRMLDTYGSAGYPAQDFIEAGMPMSDATFISTAQELNRRLKLAGLLPYDYDDEVQM